MRARTAPALPACSTPPTAAGTRTSHSSASSSSLAIRSTSMPSWPTTPARARRTSSPASRPAGFQTPPSASLTATIRQPRRARAAAAWLPTLPKPWIATRAPAQRHPDRARGLAGDHRHALARRLHPADGPAELHRLARDDRRRVAVEPPVLVHQPRHLGGTRAHVGRHDVAHRAEHLLQPVHHGPGGALELGRREAPGVEVEPALGAAEGQARQRRLPGHPGRERAHAVQVNRRVVAQAPLVGPAGAVVLHAIGREQTETRRRPGGGAPAPRSRGRGGSARAGGRRRGRARRRPRRRRP